MVRRVVLGLIISSILMVSGVTAEDTRLSQDEIAVRKAIESYVETYNRGDASAAASHWSRDGSYLTQTGEYVKGPDKIRSALEKFLAENKGIQVKVAVFDVQRQSAGQAIAKGFATFHRPGEENEEVFVTATYVKESGAMEAPQSGRRGILCSTGHNRRTRAGRMAHWRLGGSGRYRQCGNKL